MKLVKENNEETILQEGESLFVNPVGDVKVIPSGYYGVLLEEPIQDVQDFIEYACRYYGYEGDVEDDGAKKVFALNVLRKYAAEIVNKGRDEDATNKALESKPEVNKVIIE